MAADLDLARELVAHPRWRWAPGMKIADYGPGIRYCWQDETHLHGAAEEGGAWMRLPKSRIGSGAYLPDLADAATGGILLSWMPPGTRADHNFGPAEDGGSREHWLVAFDGIIDSADTLGEAAARALLALWGPA